MRKNSPKNSPISVRLKGVLKFLSLIGKPFFLLFYSLTFIIQKLSFWTKQQLLNLSKKIYPTPSPTRALGLKLWQQRVKRKRKVSYHLQFKPTAFFVIIGSFFLVFLFWFSILKNLPSPRELVNRNLEVSTKIYDRNGILLYQIYKDQNRTVIPLDQIPKIVQMATLAAEDAEFYTHPGFSIRGISRALIKNLKEKKITGGSTITQQLVKNALLTPEKTLSRKIKELILAIEVESIYTKDQILEMYLNQVSYGGTAYGISEAAKTYFGKSVTDLNLAEAALLAGLPKSPTKLSPYGQNPNLAIERQKEVLNLMKINKYISEDEILQAENEKLTFISKRTDIKAPHFIIFVKEQLEDEFSEEVVASGGLEVTTTLDYTIQKMAEAIVRTEITNLKKINVTNAAVLVLNPKNGEILAMVGSYDYFDIPGQGNVNVVNSLRQPGSSIKIVNYAYALSNGFTPASILSDTPITFPQKGSEPYTPKNYDGKFKGNLTLRSAFAESRNIPAVRVLNSYGVPKMLELGKKMGITTWKNSENYGLSLTLGGGDVKLFDLAYVYATVANQGQKPEAKTFLKISDYKGKVLKEIDITKLPENKQVIGKDVAFLLTNILSDNNARAPSFGLNSQLVIKNHPEVAVKTGTSNNLRDNLTIGYNQDYLVAVWVGNNNNSPMNHVASGVTGASPIWNKIMTNLLQNQQSIEWEIPEGLTKVSICTYTQTLACEGCANKVEWFIEGTQPKKHCIPETIKDLTQPKPQPQILEEGAATSR